MKPGWGHALRSSGLLRLEASRARVFQYGLKTGGGAMRVVHVTLLRMLRRSDAKDGWFDGVGCGAAQVGPNYPYFIIVFFLAHRGILVFWFLV
jgi:hypothetical protein